MKASAAQIKRLHLRIEECLDRACSFSEDFKAIRPKLVIQIKTSLRGKTAGMFSWKLSVENICTLKFHQVFLAENEEHYLSNTVPHEVAHLVQWAIHDNGRQRFLTKPHGSEWKNIMQAFGLKPNMRHEYAIDSIKSVQNQTAYTCGCAGKVIMLSKIRHGKIQKGTKYRCRDCKSVIAISQDVVAAKPALPKVQPKAKSAHQKHTSKFTVALYHYKTGISNGHDRKTIVADIASKMETNLKNASTWYSRCKAA